MPYIEDAPTAVLHHRGGKRLNGVVAAHDIGVVHQLPQFIFHVDRLHAACQAGIVYQNIQMTKAVQHIAGNLFHIVPNTDIHQVSDGPSADILCHFKNLLAPACQNDRCAFLRHDSGNALANASCCAGYKCDFSV